MPVNVHVLLAGPTEQALEPLFVTVHKTQALRFQSALKLTEKHHGFSHFQIKTVSNDVMRIPELKKALETLQRRKHFKRNGKALEQLGVCE